MKKSRILSLVLAVVLMVTCLPVSAFAAGEDASKIVDAAYSVVVDEEAGTTEEHTYKVYLPAGYTEDNHYPSVYLMPQDGYASKQYVDDGIQARLDELISSSAILPMVVVMPDFAEGDDYRALLPEIVADVEADYSVIADKDYRAILGVGVGGYMAYETAFVSKSTDFVGFGAHTGDFTSDANPYKGYGDIAAAVKSASSLRNSKNFYYLDAPNGDPFTTTTNGTTTIGTNLMSKSSKNNLITEYAVLDGVANAEFYLASLARSLGGFNKKFSNNLIAGSLSCTPQAVTPTDDSITAKATISVKDGVAKFVTKVPDVKVTVRMIDPVDGAVLASASETVNGLEIGAETTKEFQLKSSDMAASTNTTVALYAEILGVELELQTVTLLKVKALGESDGEKQIDLMGNWYFNAYKSYRAAAHDWDDVANVTPDVYEKWETVQPALGWWADGFSSTLTNPENESAYAWYIRTFDMPSKDDFPTEGLLMAVGKFDEANEVFINGHYVGSNGMKYTGEAGVGGVYDGSNPWDVNNVYKLDSSFLNYGGKNTIAVRMCNSTGGGGWYEGPVGIYSQAAYNQAAGKPSTYAPQDVQNAVLELVEKQNAAIEAEDLEAYAATLSVDYFESGFDKDRRVAQMAEWFEAYDNIKVEDVVTGVFEYNGLYNYQAVRKFTGVDTEGNEVAIVPPATEPDTIDENKAYEVYDYYKMNGDEAIGYGSHSRFYYDSYTSVAKKGTQTFRVYLPEGYFDTDNAKRYPTMYLMHGINSQSKTFVLDKIDRIMDEAIANGEIRETIVIIPDEPGKANGGWNVSMVADDLVPAVDSRLRTIDDARYRYTAGCSMGGGGSFNVGLNTPTKFSGVISFYGALNTGYVNASKEYLDQYGIFMVCGNTDMWGFYNVQEQVSGILTGKDVEHYHYIDNGGHDSVFYLPQFVKAVKYIEAKAYKTEGKAVDGATGSVAVDGLKVDYSAELPADVLNYINTILYKDGTASAQALNVPVEVRVVQDGVIVASTTDFYELGPVGKAKAKASVTFENSLEFTSEAFDADKAYTVDVYASVLEDTKLVASKTVEPAKAPAKVKNVKAELAAYNSVKVSWDKADDATEYYVYYKRDFVEKYTCYKKVTGTSTTLKNLYAGYKYNIKVVAVNGELKGPESAVKSVTTLKKVTGVKVVRNGKKVTVSWTNINGETGYQISRAIKDVKANITTHKGANLTKATITLTENPGKRYYYVRAYKEVNGKKVYGPWSAKVYK